MSRADALEEQAAEDARLEDLYTDVYDYYGDQYTGSYTGYKAANLYGYTVDEILNEELGGKWPEINSAEPDSIKAITDALEGAAFLKAREENPEYDDWFKEQQGDSFWDDPLGWAGDHIVDPLGDFAQSSIDLVTDEDTLTALGFVGGMSALTGGGLSSLWTDAGASTAGGAVDATAPTAQTATSGLGMGVDPYATTEIATGVSGAAPIETAIAGGTAGTNALGTGETIAGASVADDVLDLTNPNEETIDQSAADIINTGSALDGVLDNGINDVITGAGDAVGDSWTDIFSDLGTDDWLDILGGLGSAGLTYYYSDEALDLLEDQYNQTREDMLPWLESGTTALGEIESALETGYDPFEFQLETDPVYQQSLDDALQASTRQMTALGYGNSGNILDELQNTAIGEANNYQNDAYNRQLGEYSTNYSTQYLDPLNVNMGLAGLGQTTSNALGSSTASYGDDITDVYDWTAGGYNNALSSLSAPFYSNPYNFSTLYGV